MEYEKCYVFEPEDARPVKRRRIEDQKGLQTSWGLRKKTYRNNCSTIQSSVDNVLDNINSATTHEITDFLDSTLDAPGHSRIPTGIILGGPNATSNKALVQQISRHDGQRLFVSLSSGSVSNLKGGLRTLIQRATSSPDQGDDDDEALPATTKKGVRLLNYDLQILHDFVREKKARQVVLYFEDTEAFDGGLLSELIEIIGSWLDRIPFVCLFSIATSVDFLQQRLSRDAIRWLNGHLFDVAPSGEEVEAVFDAIVSAPSVLLLGPNLVSTILDRQTDFIQSIESMVDGVKYAHMSAFYANALTVFLDPDIEAESISSDHFESVRTLDSFKTAAKALLDEGSTDDVKELLESDEILFGYIQDQLNRARLSVQQIVSAVDTIRSIQRHLLTASLPPRSALYVQAMSGKLAASPMLRSLLLSVRKTPSDTAARIMESMIGSELPPELADAVEELSSELTALIEEQEDKTQALRSEEDVKNSTLRTTVVAQKVELSKQKSTLSKQDAAYTNIIRRLSEALETFFNDALIDPKDLPLHELFLYDLKSPYRDVFMPRQRFAVERALASPHDYLDCECCAPGKDESEESTLSASQPVTAILYQLYLESGSLINASDLWNAYRAVVGEEHDEAQAMAQFQRGLAELKYLGMLKPTRKRVDHFAKVAWRGL